MSGATAIVILCGSVKERVKLVASGSIHMLPKFNPGETEAQSVNSWIVLL